MSRSEDEAKEIALAIERAKTLFNIDPNEFVYSEAEDTSAVLIDIQQKCLCAVNGALTEAAAEATQTAPEPLLQSPPDQLQLMKAITRPHLAAVADALNKHFGGLGFAVMVFPTGIENAQGHYVSNCQKSEMITALRNIALRIEQGHDVNVSVPTETIN